MSDFPYRCACGHESVDKAGAYDHLAGCSHPRAYPPGSFGARIMEMGDRLGVQGLSETLLDDLARSIPGQIRATDPELADRMDSASR